MAVWGPTGLGVASGHETLAAGFLGSLLDSPLANLGTAALAGKLKMAASSPASPDLIDTFTLLGDPATRLAAAARLQNLFLPVVHQ